MYMLILVEKLSLYLSSQHSIFYFQVGCGHGLPGIFALLEVKLVHFGFALASLTCEKYNNVLVMVALGGCCCTFSRLQC